MGVGAGEQGGVEELGGLGSGGMKRGGGWGWGGWRGRGVGRGG